MIGPLLFTAAIAAASPLPSGEGQGDGSSHPGPFTLPSFRLHVLADDSLDADRLKPLARDGVVLWLRTQSNTLRLSTVEALARFRDAYVQVRAPVNDAQARLLSKAPNAGLWLRDGDVDGEGIYRLGPRRVAVQLDGMLEDARVAKVTRSHASMVIWEPGDSVDLLSLGRFRLLPGRKLVRVDALTTQLGDLPGSFCNDVSFWVDARKAVPGKERGWPAGCSRGSRVRVRFDVTDDTLLWLYRRDPSVELEVDIQANDEGASMARALIERLSAAVPGGGKRR